MIPFGAETVTLLHRLDGKTWTGCVVRGAFLKKVRTRTMNGETVERTEESICRIPYGNVMPEPGDAIIPGEWAGEASTEIELVRLVEAHRDRGAFRVRSVSHNARPGMPLPHYAARGD